MRPFSFQVIDFPRFEDEFKLGGGEVIEDMTDGTPTSVRRASKRPETVSLLDPNRLRNVGKGQCKVDKFPQLQNDYGSGWMGQGLTLKKK